MNSSDRTAAIAASHTGTLNPCVVRWLLEKVPDLERILHVSNIGHSIVASHQSLLLWKTASSVCRGVLEELRKHFLRLPRMLYRLRFFIVDRRADNNQRHHSHSVMRCTFHAETPSLPSVTVICSFILPLKASAPSGIIPLMDSASWPLSVGTKVTVSPGSAWMKSGWNTMAPFSPLLSICTW